MPRGRHWPGCRCTSCAPRRGRKPRDPVIALTVSPQTVDEIHALAARRGTTLEVLVHAGLRWVLSMVNAQVIEAHAAKVRGPGARVGFAFPADLIAAMRLRSQESGLSQANLIRAGIEVALRGTDGS